MMEQEEKQGLHLLGQEETPDSADADLQGDNAAAVEEVDPLAAAAEVFAAYVRERSGKSAVVPLKAISFYPPPGLTRELIGNLIADLSAHEVLVHVKSVQGQKDVYYYDTEMMTDRYAELASLLEDKDLLATIAKVVRFESKRYPRPTRVLSLMDSPYFFTKDEVLGAVARMKLSEEYQDIDTVTASNNNICIYSTQFMSKRYAQALCEEIEVERYQNQ